MRASGRPLLGRRAPGRAPVTTLAVLLLALPMIACGAQQEFAVGSPAPTFEVPTPAGGTLALDSFAGTPTVVNFWATWCGPCVQEMPELDALAASGTAEVIGIALDEGGAEQVQSFVDEIGVSYPIGLGDQDLFLSYRGFGVPHTVLLDADLVVRKIYRGPVTREELASDIAAMSAGT